MAARIGLCFTGIIFILGLFASCRSQIELDESFLELRREGMWLVEFYAPWCGHCKKLEPVYREVARELLQAKSPIRVAKVDCTMFSSLATEFGVRGFPTIMFISGDQVYHHKGDRSKESILEFAKRAQGPTLRKLSSVGKFNEALSEHNSDVFFLHVGDGDEHEDVFEKYSFAAKVHAVHSYFYYGKKHILENTETKNHPTLLVFKDNESFEYEAPGGIPTASSVQEWINRERFATFPRISGPSINELASVTKYLVILAVDPDKLKNSSSSDSRLFSLVKLVAKGNRQHFHSEFQFLWMDEVETVSSIAMSFLSTPAILVMEPEQQLYYMTATSKLTISSLITFLTNIAEGKEKPFGGTGFFMRVWRLIFDILSTILSIWQASRWLFLLMFGLPTLIISVICYSLCCMDTIDDVRDEDEYDSEEEESEQPPPALLEGEKGLPSYDEAIKESDDIPIGQQDKKND